jgi:hypothetical protein
VGETPLTVMSQSDISPSAFDFKKAKQPDDPKPIKAARQAT